MTDDYYEQLRMLQLIALLSKDSITTRVCRDNKSVEECLLDSPRLLDMTLSCTT